MPEYPWLCLGMSEYAGMTFVLHFPICFTNPFSTWTRGYLFKCLYDTRGYSLKDYEDVFLKKQNLIFPIAAGNISSAFCFRLNIFTCKI